MPLGRVPTVVVGPLVLFALKGRFFGVFAAALTVLYSAIPYKTPWNAVGIVFALAICAGIAVARWRWTAAIAAAAIVLAARTDWSYARTLPSVFAVRDAIDRFPAEIPIDVYTRENLWPLPWYLRRHPTVRWFVKGVPPDAGAAPVVVLTPDAEADVAKRLYEAPPPGQRDLYVPLFEPVELRQGLRLSGYVAASLRETVR